MFDNFICDCPFCKEAAKWPKHNPYTEHNAHEEAVRDALHQAERDNVIKDEIIEDLRKKLAKSEEKHKKATKMVKVLMKERENMITCLHNRMEKVDELLVKNAELKKMNENQRHVIEDSGYISMSEYDNAIKERNVYKSKCTTYERLYDDVCKRYNELYDRFDAAVNECVAAKSSNQEKSMYRDSQLHKDNLKTIYKLEEENKELKKEKEELNDRHNMICDRSDKLLKEIKELRNRYEAAIKEKNDLKDAYSAYVHSYDDVCKKYDELDGRYNNVNRERHNLKESNEELLNEINKFKEITNNQRETINTHTGTIFELRKENKDIKLKLVNEQSNREYFQNKFYDKCKECDKLTDENEKLSHRIPATIRVENGGINLQTFVPKAKYDYLEQKYWDAQRLIDKYAQSEEKTKEYLNALTELYFDECVKTREDCPLFGGFRGGKIFGDH